MDVEPGEEVLRIALPHASGVADLAHRVVRGAPKLVAGEVLLHLLLQRRGQRDSRLLAEADLEHLRVGEADADVEASVVPLRLQQVPADGCREDTQIGDVHARRREARDHRPLEHPACSRRLAASNDTRSPLERGSESRGQPDRGLGSQIDVHEPGDAVLAEEVR